MHATSLLPVPSPRREGGLTVAEIAQTAEHARR